MSNLKIWLYVIGGIIALVLGGKWVVDSAVAIARSLNVSERIIGLTVVAFGTSLPELVTCIIAALKKQSDIAIGNIIGSNIFNILFVLGIAGLIHTIPFDFAFLIDDRNVDYNEYGDEAVIFRTSGVEIYHHGDSQNQVVFI